MKVKRVSKKSKIIKLITLGNTKTALLSVLAMGLFLIVPALIAYSMFTFSYFLGEVSQNIPVLSSLFSRTKFPSAEIFVGALGGAVGLFLFLVIARIKIDFSKKESE